MMSSPVAIPRASHAIAGAISGSSTGLYVPVHKRGGSVASSPSPSERSISPSSSQRRRNGREKSNSPRTPTMAAPRTVSHARATKIPFVYDMSELLSLASSPLAGITPAQHERIEALLTFTVAQPGASSSEKTTRRRRPARRSSSAKKLAVSVNADVESRRKRHANWGWQAHAGLEESWRHASSLKVSA